jgi:uncharacterized coiled-coil protein SlyX
MSYLNEVITEQRDYIERVQQKIVGLEEELRRYREMLGVRQVILEKTLGLMED